MIKVLARQEFIRLCKENNWTDDNLPDNFVFISITDTPDLHYLNSSNKVLNVEFGDVDPISNEPGCLSIDLGLKILDFIEKNKGKDFIIHCMAGMSRSAGIAYFIWTYYLEMSDCPWPLFNRGVYRRMVECYYFPLTERDIFEFRLDCPRTLYPAVASLLESSRNKIEEIKYLPPELIVRFKND